MNCKICKNPNMKCIIKKWWFWLIIILILFCISAIVLITNKTNGVGSAGINNDEYNQIQLGMSQFEVDGIINKLDEWNNDEIYKRCCEEISNLKKEHVYTCEYKYYGEKNGYAIITYEVDYSDGIYFKIPEVVKKEKFNLK